MFNGPFKEGQTQLSKLPEDNIHVFKLFLGWLYLGIIEIPSTQFFVDYSHLYAFADKYCISELADATMDKMCKVSAHKKWMPTESEITVCYELTPRKSKLSLFFARCLAWVSLHISGDRADKLWTNEGLRDTVKGNDDLSLQFFDLLRFQSGKPLPDPREAPACDYHQHTKDEPCPYIKQ
ncbi:hypothetical protein BDZ45DRAFT_673277 [Acephala macrosclerotiorum]|nr:hypothetical protein BDZ45DRAFT_673277 [Acephala macrosclerotiorum]